MYLIISRLKFNINPDSYCVEAQDEDFGRIHEKMKALQLLNTEINIPKNFYVTYYANKHEKFITRKGTWTKPNTDTQGKYFVSKQGKPCFIYYDLDADGWRMATWAMTIKERGFWNE